jgi:ABC-type nitrate/sulfonate/bicarbonate transport system substrate-binding protein
VRSRRLAAVALALAGALLCIPPVASAAPESITLAVASNTGANWPLYVAQSTGLFAKYGLTVQVVNAGSVASVAQQLVTGAADVGDVSSTQNVEAIQGGAPIHAVVNRVAKPTYTLIARKDVHTPAELKGKLLIVGGVNDITRIFTDAMLSANGLKPGEYDYTYAGGTNERYAALKSGSVAAAILSPPYDFRAISEGYTMLGSAVKTFPSFPFTGFDANDRWASTHRQALVAFIEAHLAAVAWLYDPKNRNGAIDILAKATGSTPDDARRSYDELIVRDHVFSATGLFSPRDEDQVVGALTKLGAIKPPIAATSRFYDDSFAREALRALGRKP